MGIELTLLGPFQLQAGGKPVALRNRKAQALLVYLALTGKAHGREKLASLLWGDRFEEQARRSLRQCIFALRKDIGADLIEGDAEIRLKPGAHKVDALDLQPDAPYPGDLLPDFRSGEQEFDDWLDGERRRIRSEAAYMYRDHADRLEKDGMPEQALAAAELAFFLEPADERLARLVIALLAGLGRRTEALARYAAFRDFLKAELGVSPETATQALEAQIRSDDPVVRSGSRNGSVGFCGFDWLIAPFEDLGGGDSATFLAKEIPTAIIQHKQSERFHTANLLSGAAAGDDLTRRLALAREQGGIWLYSGTTRQVGERVRVSITGTDIASGDVLAGKTFLVSEEDSFDFLDRVGAIASALFISRYRHLDHVDETVIDRLKQLTGHPDRFVSVAQEYFNQTFYINTTRESLRELERVSDFALGVFPTRGALHAMKGWAHFSYTDLLNARQRIEGIKNAARYMDRAVALDPNNMLGGIGRACASYWLGDFKTAHRLLDQLMNIAYPVVSAIRGNSLIFEGKPEAGIEVLRTTLELGTGVSSSSYWFSTFGLGHLLVEDFEAALTAARNAQEFSREYWLGHLVKIAALAKLGRLDECPAAIAGYHAEYPGATVGELEWMPFADPSARKLFFCALREGGLPE